jgi:DNA-binding response OmpR family regulator/nitrogen-specific signal transduction histidine kinase
MELELERIEKEKVLELEQIKSRFFTSVTHEFRTPLTLILGPIEDLVLRNSEKYFINRDIVRIIYRNASRLKQLINQLLDISKLETGQLKLLVSEGQVEEFVRRILHSFLSMAESKRITYAYDLPVTSTKVYFDRDKLEKILTNLISNAFKFTPEGGRINISMKNSRAQGESGIQFIEIEVSDTGRGIPEDQLDQIFQRFYQVSTSDKQKEAGTGIGLALTKELVELHRGKISVESEPGRGSSFTVKLPVSRDHFHEEEILSEPAEELTAKETAIPGIDPELPDEIDLKNSQQEDVANAPIILIVEDNHDLTHYISQHLRESYRILTAENGKAGLGEAIDHIPDLIISDVMMPVMDGVEMCQKIKKDERTNHIPVIMLTARTEMDSKLEGLESGADDYIFKPFDIRELRARITNLIHQKIRLRKHFRKEFLIYPGRSESPAPEDEFLVRLMDCINIHLAEPEFNVGQLGKEIGFSRAQLYRKILAITDQTPSELIRNTRLRMAARMFREKHKNVTRVMYAVGFNNSSYFAKCFSELYGSNPSEYIIQNKHPGKNV